jgi:hypothetical protein
VVGGTGEVGTGEAGAGIVAAGCGVDVRAGGATVTVGVIWLDDCASWATLAPTAAVDAVGATVGATVCASTG